ncbi:MAG: dienelactone hydrolase family protein [Verrucomicrobiota bacterium]
MKSHRDDQKLITVCSDSEKLEGMLGVPAGATGIVLFAHGSGSSRHSPRNNYVAEQLRDEGIGTLLFDLLTVEEDRIDRRTRKLRFDIDLLTRRLAGATEWLLEQEEARGKSLGYFGASTGAAAALKAAALQPECVQAVVSRGGRPDLAGAALSSVAAPVLLIVGGLDVQVEKMNRDAVAQLGSEHKEVHIVEGATHLFEEPGKLNEVSRLAADWFKQWLRR